MKITNRTFITILCKIITYMHEIILFELFRGLHYSFRGVFE